MKKATTVEEQIQIFEERGMVITDKKKAKEILLDIGFYRLGFCSFPFEINYPDFNNRNHKLKPLTSFEDVVALYYFDQDLRHLLMRYIYRIEVNLRTQLIYFVSNYYKDSPTWFVDPSVVQQLFIDEFDYKVYSTIEKKSVIERHHVKYPKEFYGYAPAWKTLEFMTFGNILTLYTNLLSRDLKREIAQLYNIPSIRVFENYFNTIRVIRNACAHVNHICDLKLSKSIKKGLIPNFPDENRQDICGIILVLIYILDSISENRKTELIDDFKKIIDNLDNKDVIKNIIIFSENVL